MSVCRSQMFVNMRCRIYSLYRNPEANPANHALDRFVLLRVLHFLFMFSVSVGLCSGFPGSSSLVLPLLSGTGFSVCLLTSNTESSDEHVEEVGVGVAEELVDKPGPSNGTQCDILQSILLPFLVRYGFWSLVQC